jgi:hypothetical protein
MKTIYVMDYETMINFFCGVFVNIKTKEKKVFVVHRSRNDIIELLKFLKENKKNNDYHVSINGMAFDAQITEFLLKFDETAFESGDPEMIANELYDFAQSVISAKNNDEYLPFKTWEYSINQIDLFLMRHWNNPAKSCSLKWAQYSMDWYNIQEMPYKHYEFIVDDYKVKEIVDYCINDCLSTLEVYNSSRKELILRRDLSNEYGKDLLSASEPGISKEIFLYFLSKKTGLPEKLLKKLRTYRDEIVVNDILLDFIEFQTPEFKKIHEKFKKLVIDPSKTKGNFKESLTFKNCDIEFAQGGIHGARAEGVYSSTDDMVIVSSDFVSYYPRLVITNNWSPKHLDQSIFCEQYEWFFNERIKIPKSDPRNYVYKIILNSTFGLSMDENSFLYDPLLGMRITLNGQLVLAMFFEKVLLAIEGSKPLMINTDGLEILIPRNKVDEYYKMAKEFEELTKMTFEHEFYDKLILRDVNNYIGIYKKKEVNSETYANSLTETPEFVHTQEGNKFFIQKTKCKGAFEFKNLPLHKNKSFLIIRKAIYDYFVKGISVETTIKSSKNLFDFCGGVKSKGEWEVYSRCIKGINVTERPLQKVTRYFVTNKYEAKCHIYRKNRIDGREIYVISDPSVSLKELNVYDETEINNVNYQWYISKSKDEIENILKININQYKLF